MLSNKHSSFRIGVADLIWKMFFDRLNHTIFLDFVGWSDLKQMLFQIIIGQKAINDALNHVVGVQIGGLFYA